MKKVLFIAGLLVIFGAIFAFNHYTSQEQQSIAGRGCCSRHGGVCGCQNGRSRCCDGTLSPSCQCFRDDVKGLGI